MLGDLALDIVIVPARPLETSTDVPGRVAFVQGGSAANTARWLARLALGGVDRVGSAYGTIGFVALLASKVPPASNAMTAHDIGPSSTGPMLPGVGG